MARTLFPLLCKCLLSTLALLCMQCHTFDRKDSVAEIEDIEEVLKAAQLNAAQEESAPLSLAMLHVPFTQEQREAISLKTVTPTRRVLQQQQAVFGKILPNQQHYAHVVTQLSGVVREVHKQRGSSVKSGESLALLESPELADAVAAYIAALHQRDVAERNLIREERLYQQQLVAENAWIEAANSATQRRMEVVFAEQKLCSMGLQTDQVAQLPKTSPSTWRQMTLRAPFEGVVLEHDLVVGEWVSAQHGAFTVVDLNTVWAQLELPTLMMESIAMDKSLTLYDLLSREHATGRMIYMSPSLNPENLTVHVVLEVDNHSKKWRLGSSVEAQLLTGEKDAPLTLPSTAIQRIDGQEVAFVEVEEGFAVRPVEVGLCDGHCVEILGGLVEGDRCVADQTFILKSQLVLRESEEAEKEAEKGAAEEEKEDAR